MVPVLDHEGVRRVREGRGGGIGSEGMGKRRKEEQDMYEYDGIVSGMVQAGLAWYGTGWEEV